MQKKFFSAFILIINTLFVSSQALAVFDSKDFQVNAEITPLIKIQNLQDSVTIDKNNPDGDENWWTVWIDFTVSRQGPEGTYNYPYSITVSGDKGEGNYYKLPQVGGPQDSFLNMQVAFADDYRINEAPVLTPGVSESGFTSAAAINSSDKNAHINLSIPTEDIKYARPGTYSTTLTLMVAAQ